MKVVAYVRGKNAKKYRHGAEYGTARWGTAQDIEPYNRIAINKGIELMNIANEKTSGPQWTRS